MITKFVTRAYNKIDKLSFGRIKKTSSSPRLGDEINYYNNIPNNASFLFPRKLDSFSSTEEYSLVLEYYPYKTLGDYIISETELNWIETFDQLNDTIQLLTSIKDYDSKNKSEYASQIYLQKTENEYFSLKKIYKDNDLFNSDKLIINDIEYYNFETIWEDKIVPKIKKYLLNYESTMIHGDMCFSNMLYHPQVGTRFIDMRGSFGKLGIYGDIMYDFAKLSHSVDGGYEFMINDKFTVNKIKDNMYFFDIQETPNKKQASEAFWNKFGNTKPKELIKLVEGLIYIGMCARHYDSSFRQLTMYLTGIRLLNQIL